jgi:hypothetical protein
MKKKKIIFIVVILVLVAAAAALLRIPAGRGMFASVIDLASQPVQTIKKCKDPSIMFACANCATTPEVVLACSLGLSTCPVACQNPIATTWATCPSGCATAVCHDAWVVAGCLENPTGPLCPVACQTNFWTNTQDNCSDPNIMYACANCNTPENVLSCLLGLDTCPAACMWPVTNTTLTCPVACGGTPVCTDSDGGINYSIKGFTKWLFITNHQYTENYDYCLQGTSWAVENFCNNWSYVDITVNLCNNGCNDGACNGWAGYGYGYGYGWTPGTGYGYGYGYAKLDPVTKKPYIYLINVFKTYSKKVYETAMSKLGTLKMVNFYNKKEFTPKEATSKTTALPTRK